MFQAERAPQELSFGRQGESNILSYAFDFSEWAAEWPGGLASMTVILPNQTQPQPIPDTQAVVDGTIITLHVLDNLTEKDGRGTLIIRYVAGQNKKRSRMIEFVVEKGHETQVGSGIAVVDDWVDEATKTLNDVKTLTFTINDDGELLADDAVLGSVRLKYKGPHNPATEYSFNNWVSANGGSYAYINPTPATGVPLTDTSHWQQIASGGGQAKSVREYGAKGDGVTDDTIAIQAAFDDIAIDGGALYIPTGVYLVSGLVLNHRTKSPRCRIYIYGDGWNSVLKLKDNSNNDLIYGTWCDRAVFTRFRLDGNRANNTSGSCLVLTDNSAYACIEGMEIHDAAEYGVSVMGGFDPQEPTNYLYTDEIHINQSFIYWNGKSGVRLQGVGGCIITNSELQYNEEHGLCTTFNGVSGTNGHIISGCNILSNKKCGIHLFIASRVTISNNVFCFNRSHGVYSEGDGWNWIIGNQFEDNCQDDHASQIKTCFQTDVWILNNIITNVDTVNPGAWQGIASWSGGNMYLMGNSVTNHQYGSLAVYDGTTYISLFNEGIPDSMPSVSAKIYPATVSGNVITVNIPNYMAGQIYYISLDGSITSPCSISINGEASVSLINNIGNEVSSLVNGAVVSIWQPAINLPFQQI